MVLKYPVANLASLKYNVFPFAISISWSSKLKMSEFGWCIVHTTVLPELAKSDKISTIFVAVNESSPVVGSSKNIRLGSVINSTPIDVRLRSPPETPLMSSPPIVVSDHLVNFRSLIKILTLSSLFTDAGSLICAAKLSHSRTVIVSSMMSSCCTYPMHWE